MLLSTRSSFARLALVAGLALLVLAAGCSEPIERTIDPPVPVQNPDWFDCDEGDTFFIEPLTTDSVISNFSAEFEPDKTRAWTIDEIFLTGQMERTMQSLYGCEMSNSSPPFISAEVAIIAPLEGVDLFAVIEESAIGATSGSLRGHPYLATDGDPDRFADISITVGLASGKILQVGFEDRHEVPCKPCLDETKALTEQLLDALADT